MGAIPTLEELRAGCDELDGVELLMVLAGPGGPLHHRTALVSSFGAESAALLHMVASVDPATPVIFLDTGKHFPETLAYRDQLVDWFGLLNVINATPDQLSLAQSDRNGQLYVNDPDLCCHIRKAEPLESSLREFAAWITGRKRFQGGLRSNLETIETEPSTGRLKLNPIAGWSAERIEAYRRDYGLPAHPLAKRGYRSIGCAPCTGPTAPGEPARSGRWPGLGKFECGIHRPVADLPPMPASAVPDGSVVLGRAAALLPGPTSSRHDILTPLLNRLAGATRLEGAAEAQRWFRAIDVIVPNIDLRTVLCTDPALAALLPGFYGTIGLDEQAPGLRIGARGAIGLNPKLFRDPAALRCRYALGHRASGGRAGGTHGAIGSSSRPHWSMEPASPD